MNGQKTLFQKISNNAFSWPREGPAIHGFSPRESILLVFPWLAVVVRMVGPRENGRAVSQAPQSSRVRFFPQPILSAPLSSQILNRKATKSSFNRLSQGVSPMAHLVLVKLFLVDRCGSQTCSYRFAVFHYWGAALNETLNKRA